MTRPNALADLRALGTPALAALALLIVPVGVVAIGSGSGLIALPFEMHLVDLKLPGVFRVHMLASALVLLMLPVVIAIRHRARLHRMMGRLLGAFVVIGGLTALPVAIFSHSSLPARAGFFAQGVVWLALFLAGWRAIRAGERDRHIVMMLAMAAVTTGAVWFRVVTGTAILLDLPFEATYAVATWICWLVPLALAVSWRGQLVDWAHGARPQPLAREPLLV